MPNRQPAIRQSITLALLTVALATTTVACGSDDEPATVATTASTTASADPTDGRLTTRDGEIITDYGDPHDRVAAVEALTRLQQDFQAGRMTAACSKIDDFLLSQFTPPGTQDSTACPRKLAAYAAQRRRNRARPLRLKLLWVRSYGTEAGIWVDDRDRRTRLQFNATPNGGWQFQLGALRRPDILAATLTGSDRYHHDQR